MKSLKKSDLLRATKHTADGPPIFVKVRIYKDQWGILETKFFAGFAQWRIEKYAWNFVDLKMASDDFIDWDLPGATPSGATPATGREGTAVSMTCNTARLQNLPGCISSPRGAGGSGASTYRNHRSRGNRNRWFNHNARIVLIPENFWTFSLHPNADGKCWWGKS